MPTGTVKWFNEASGYGFVMPDEGGEDIFVHRESIGAEDLSGSFSQGDRVEYELRDGGMGREAIHVAPLPAERDG
jgi:cold shock protein